MPRSNVDRMSIQPGHRVVVVGAGYAGVLAANRLLSSAASAGDGVACSVTVVNPRPDFIERIRLHEVAAGTRATAATPLRAVLHPDAALVIGKVALIDPDEHVAEVLADRAVESIHYDTLVYAVGSAADQSILGSPNTPTASRMSPVPTPSSRRLPRSRASGECASSVVT